MPFLPEEDDAKRRMSVIHFPFFRESRISCCLLSKNLLPSGVFCAPALLQMPRASACARVSEGDPRIAALRLASFSVASVDATLLRFHCSAGSEKKPCRIYTFFQKENSIKEPPDGTKKTGVPIPIGFAACWQPVFGIGGMHKNWFSFGKELTPPFPCLMMKKTVTRRRLSR